MDLAVLQNSQLATINTPAALVFVQQLNHLLRAVLRPPSLTTTASTLLPLTSSDSINSLARITINENLVHKFLVALDRSKGSGCDKYC